MEEFMSENNSGAFVPQSDNRGGDQNREKRQKFDPAKQDGRRNNYNRNRRRRNNGPRQGGYDKKGDNAEIQAEGKSQNQNQNQNQGQNQNRERNSDRQNNRDKNNNNKFNKPQGQNQEGGIIKVETPIYACKVMRVCPKCNKPTKPAFRFLDDGTKARVCKKCGEII